MEDEDEVVEFLEKLNFQVSELHEQDVDADEVPPCLLSSPS